MPLDCADTLRRHDLLTASPEGWDAALAGRPDLADLPHVSRWAAEGRPLIVRRRHPGEETGHLPVGLPLPPALGKRRIGLALPGTCVTRREPVSLREASAAAPVAWRATLQALMEHGAPDVFGALLWQFATGLTYLTAGSDLDMIWRCAGPVPRAFLDGLAAIDRESPMRLDGELILPDGRGISWRELHAARPGGTVLAKRLDGVDLLPVEDVLAVA